MFISFEGIDGSGKSTALNAAQEFLKAQGVRTISIRQPGGTPVGEEIRNIVKYHPDKLSPMTQVLLLAASFRDVCERIIVPEMRAGTWVLCDRFTDSTIAYQCGGAGANFADVLQVLTTVVPCRPDKTIYYDVAPEVAAGRTSKRQKSDNIEMEGMDYQARVRSIYLELAQKHTYRIVTIDTGALERRESAKQTIRHLDGWMKENYL